MRSVLLIVVLSVLLPLSLVQLWLFHAWYLAEVNAQRRHNEEVAEAVATLFRSFVHDILRQERAIGEALSLLDFDPTRAAALMPDTLQEYDMVRAFHWISPAGIVQLSSDPKAVGMDLHDREYLHDVVNGAPWSVSNALNSRMYAEPVFVVVRGMYVNGKLAGIVSTSLDPLKLTQFRGIPSTSGTEIVLVDRAGQVVSLDRTDSSGTQTRHWPPLNESNLRLGIVGKALLSEFGWKVIVNVPREAAVAPLRKSMRAGLTLFLLVGISAVFAAISISGHILNGVRRLQDQARMLALRESSARGADSHVAELNELGAALEESGLQRDAAEQISNQARQILQAVVDNTHLLVACIDQSLEFVLVNRAYADHEKRAQDFFVGKPYFDIYPDRESEAIFSHVRDTGKPFLCQAKPFRPAGTGDRDTTFWDWNLCPIKNDRGEVQLFVLSLLDVTASKKAEMVLRQSREDLERRVTLRTSELERANAALQEQIAERERAQALVADAHTATEQARDLLTSIIDGSSELIAALDLDFRFLAFNSAYKREFERVATKPVYLGMRIADALALTPEAEEEYSTIWARALGGESFVVERTYPDGKGNHATFEGSFGPIRNRRGMIVGAAHIMHDITARREAEHALQSHNEQLERRVEERTAALQRLNASLEAEIAERIRAEAALKASEEKLFFAQQAAGMGSWDWDMQTGRGLWSAECKKLFGLPVDCDVTQEAYFGAIVPEDRARVSTAIERTVYQGQDFDVEMRCCWPDGSVHWIASKGKAYYTDGQPIRMSGMALDITDRRAAEERLLDRDTRLRLAIESVKLGTFDFFPQTGQLFWSANAKKHFGLSPDAAVDFDMFLAAVHPDDRRRVEKLVEQALSPDTTGEFGADYRAVGVEDGVVRWITSKGRVFYDKDGKPVRFLGTTWDVTERKRSEEQLRTLLDSERAARTALEKAVQELDAFSYTVSHDLRAPLRAIDAFSAILAEEHAETLPDQAKRYLSLVRSNTRRMSALITDLLDFSRLSRRPLMKGIVSTEDLVRQCIEELATEYEGRQIDFRLGTLPNVTADAVLLKQVLLNLIGNAIKYSTHREVAIIEIGTRDIDGETTFAVRDNGIGFNMKHAHQLFKVFTRLHTDEKIEGTGVGLAIVHHIVTRHGGRVWAEATPDQGAAFFFTVGEKVPMTAPLQPA